MSEIKFQFIIDNKHLSPSYTIEDLLRVGATHEHVLEDMEGPCTCFLHEAMSYCEGDCSKFDESVITGKRRFSGLLDKNNKEIYEGDIISKNGKGSYKVYYDAAMFFVKYDTDSWSLSHIRNEGLEVIGNIYENES